MATTTYVYVQSDIDTRLDLINAAIAVEGKKYSDILKYGSECVGNLQKLKVILIWIDMITDYQPITLLTENWVKNCITEAELDDIFSQISRKFKLTFSPKTGTILT